MKLQLKFLSCLCALTLSLTAQTISITNEWNPAISPSSVVGDPVAVAITGAATNSLVTLTYTQNGGSQQVWNAGYTDASGNWSTTGYSPSSQIGVWTEQWAVGSTNIGPMYNLEIFDQPASLTVSAVSASSPDACGSSAFPSNWTYGPSASVKYQIVGSTGSSETVPSTTLGFVMEPEEYVTNYDTSGNIIGTIFGDIGGASGPWSPPSAQYAGSNGVFYDIPVAECSASGWSTYLSLNQVIYIYIGNEHWAVRTNNYYTSSSASGHGTLANSSSGSGDINLTQ